jgi:hypothetical protein
MYLPGVTVLTGGASPPDGVAPEDIVSVGKCMPVESRTERHVGGCPPNNALVVKGIIGNRAEVRQRYGDENVEKPHA